MHYYQCPSCNTMEKRTETTTLKCPSCDNEMMQEVDRLTSRSLDDRHADLLDSIYPECSIAGVDYTTSKALREVDPVAFNQSFLDWLDSEISEGDLINFDSEYFEVL